jgi:hypothetical protein
MSCQDIYDSLDFTKNREEWKDIIHEQIYPDYSLENISDFLMRKFLKSLRSEFKFVLSFVEEEANINIELTQELALKITERLVIKTFSYYFYL